MDFLNSLPIWMLAVGIFLLRVVDVSLGTCRTIAVVQGRTTVSVVLGFIEVLLWVTTVTHVVQHATNSPWLLLAYASGFAVGNAAGIALERRIAMGSVILRIVSRTEGDGLSEALRNRVPRVFQFEGRDNGDQMTLLYVVVRRRHAKQLIEAALAIDPDLFYAVDPLRETNWMYTQAMPVPTGWRGILMKK